MSRFAQGIAHMKKMEGKRDRDTNKSICEELPTTSAGKCAFLRKVWHADLSKKCLAVMDRLIDPESTMDYDSYNSKHRLIDNILGNIGKFHGMDFSHDDGNSMYENKKQANRVPVDADTQEYMSELLRYQPELFHDIVGSGASGSGDKKKDNGDSSGSGGDKGQEAKEDPEEEGPEPEDGGDIEILVKTPPGKTITIGVAADFKIIMMKAMVKQSAKYPVHEQKLMVGVSELQNDDTVAKSGLVNGSMVDLLLDLTGGAGMKRARGIDGESVFSWTQDVWEELQRIPVVANELATNHITGQSIRRFFDALCPMQFSQVKELWQSKTNNSYKLQAMMLMEPRMVKLDQGITILEAVRADVQNRFVQQYTPESIKEEIAVQKRIREVAPVAMIEG